jgi:hypothetical protein
MWPGRAVFQESYFGYKLILLVFVDLIGFLVHSEAPCPVTSVCTDHQTLEMLPRPSDSWTKKVAQCFEASN